MQKSLLEITFYFIRNYYLAQTKSDHIYYTKESEEANL